MTPILDFILLQSNSYQIDEQKKHVFTNRNNLTNLSKMKIGIEMNDNIKLNRKKT